MKENSLTACEIVQIACQFAWPDAELVCEPYGNGHINDTYLVMFRERDRGRSFVSFSSDADAYLPNKRRQRTVPCLPFILQRINAGVFKRPEQVMENVEAVTAWIARRLLEEGRDPEREVLQIVRTREGRPFYLDTSGDCWRAYRLIEGAVSYELALTEEIFFQSAVAFGDFQYLLSDYPADTLYETIPNFHNTPVRLRQFLDAVERDPVGRVKSVAPEIAFLKEKAYLADRLTKAAAAGSLPLRVTHNDTKLNNVMIDEKTGRGLCVIDLDTVMPGLSVTDFGDAIRFGASTGAEDEPDLTKVHFDRHLYEVYREGFMEGCRGALSKAEIDMLPDGAMVITYEQALRFLTDYIHGDVYYKTARPDHNLDRARTQIRLVSEMEQQLG